MQTHRRNTFNYLASVLLFLTLTCPILLQGQQKNKNDVFQDRIALVPASSELFSRPLGIKPDTAVNTTWTGGAGNFSNASMWTAGVPNGNFNAYIDGGNAVVSAVTLDISAGLNNLYISSGDSLAISNDLALTVNGTVLSNKGTLTMNSVGNSTELIVGGTSLTLSGTGTLSLSNNSNNLIFGTAGGNTFINQSTIQGAGSIGSNQLTLVNSGTINGNLPTQLIVNPSGGTTNTGILEATAGGTLSLQNGITNTGGTILASGAGSAVNVYGTVTGGTLTTTNGGVIQSFGGTFGGVTNTGTLQVPNNNTATLSGNMSNTGSIQLNSGGNYTELIVSAPSVTLSGTGTLSLSNNSNNLIYGSASGSTLINQSTIQGAGTIGGNVLTLVNSGTVNANLSTQLIVVPSGGTTNTGTLEATAGGTLNLQNGITNTGGTIQANGSGSTVALNGATVTGGMVTTSNGGAVQSFGGTFSGLTTSGLVQVPNNNTLGLVGNIVNTGSIQLNSGGNYTFLQPTGTVTVSGGGTITLSDNPNNYIFGATGSAFINQDNTITGSGNIGNGTTGFTNHGTVDATSANGNTLLIQTGAAGTVNTATMEASPGGTLQLQNSVTNTGGTIQALAGTGTAAGGTVLLNGATITGGLVQGAGSGVNQGYVVSTGATLVNLTTAGTVQLPNDNNLYLTGTLTNTGVIQLNSGGNYTELIPNGTVTLTGGGAVTLSDNANNYIFGAAGTKLINVNNTISGAGDIGNGTMAFTNEATVDATSTNGSHLIINTGTTSGSLVNLGTLEASSGGKLDIDSPVTNASGSTIGVIEALNGGTVSLKGATVIGGTLESTGTGLIVSDNSVLDGANTPVTFSGKLETPNDYNLSLEGTVNNNGTISLASTGNYTFLKIVGSSVTLQGTGMLSLSDNNQNYIKGASTGTEDLINKITITGAGNIGDDFLTLTNDATIEATSAAGNHLIIDPGTGGATNNGTLAATGSATLELANAINNTSGTISASGASSTVLMDGSAVITGGTLKGAGVFVSNGASLANLSTAGTIQVPDDYSLNISGTITNTGSIQLNSVGNYTYLSPSGATTLTGGGSLVLSDKQNNIISGPSGSSLVNVNNTISGSGYIGNNSTVFTNEGTVDATSSGGNHLIIASPGAGATNTSVMEASSGGTLELRNLITNTGGTITALAGTGPAAGGTVLINGATVTGGTLNSLGTGVNAGAIVSSNGTLVSLTNAGALQVPDDTATTLQGTINNTGTISVNSVGNYTYLNISGNVTLTGSGTLTLSNNVNNFIQGASTGSEVLTNDSTIEGSGNIGRGKMGLTNNGLILANQSAPLTIDASAGFTNNGTLQTSAGSTMDITGPFSNFAGTTLTGGKYVVAGTLQFAGANIVTNAAALTLTGGSASIIDQNNSNGLANFTTNAAAGKFTLSGNQNLTTLAGTFANAGTVTVSTGSTFTVGNNGNTSLATNYTQTGGLTTVNGTLTSSASTASTPTVTLQGGSLLGDGTVIDPVKSSAIVEPGDSSTATGKLAITGSYTQASSGSLDISIGGTTAGTKFDQLNVSGAATLGGTLNLKSLNGFVPTVGSTFDILNAGSRTGTFTTITGTAINSSEHYAVSYTGTEVVLTVVSGAAPGFTPPGSDLSTARTGRGSNHLGVYTPSQSTQSLQVVQAPPGIAVAPRLNNIQSFSNIVLPRFTAARAVAESSPRTIGRSLANNPARRTMDLHVDLVSVFQNIRGNGFLATLKQFGTQNNDMTYLSNR